jgi:gliding motility-associated lipoprotein GldH
MLHKSLISLSLLVVFLALISCQSNVIYDEVISTDNGNWDKNESAHFVVNITDTVSLYKFYLSVHNTTDYRYSNLFVFLSTNFPNGNKSRDTIEFVLADPSGKWIGKGWGNVKESDILLRSNLKFPLAGEYDFHIQQAMREDTLKGINSVGLRLEKSEN